MSTITDADNPLEKFGYKQELKRALSIWLLVFYGFAYLCPLTLYGSYGIADQLSHGMISLAYLVAGSAILVTGLSYYHMSRVFPLAGSAYTYISRSISPYPGFISSWGILMGYLVQPMINYILAATFIKAYFPELPTMVIAIIMIVLVGIICHIGVTTTAWVSNGIVLLQLVFYVALTIFIFDWLLSGNGAGTVLSIEPFYNSIELEKYGSGIVFAGAAILVLNFVGFDAISAMAEEVKNPEKNVGKAILIVIIVAIFFFTFGTYLLNLAWPTGWKEYAVADNGAQEVIIKAAGNIMGYLFTAIYVVATAASALAGQTATTRILYGMGRDSMLPKKYFGYIHPIHKTPTFNIIIMSIISVFACIFLPLAVSFAFLSFGSLLAFIGVNISTIVFFYGRKKQRGLSGLIKYVILPLAGVVVCFVLWISLDKFTLIFGCCWLLVGMIYLAILTKGFREKPADLNV